MEPAPFHSELADDQAVARACWCHTQDGVRLRVVVWRSPKEKATILLLSGRSEYAEKFGRVVAGFLDRGYSVITFDWRGQGLSDRLLDDPMLGHVGTFLDYQRDLAALLAAAGDLKLPEPYMMFAHSMGGCIGLRLLMDGAQIGAAAFTGPMWGIMMPKRTAPLARLVGKVGVALGFGNRYAPSTKPECYTLVAAFENNTLTTDPDMWNFMQQQVRQVEGLRLGGPSLNWLYQALAEMGELAARPAPVVPAITFLGDRERIVDPVRIHERMRGWSNGTLDVIDNAEHELLMERPDVRAHIVDRSCDLYDQALAST